MSKQQRSAGKLLQGAARARAPVSNTRKQAAVSRGPGRPTAARVEAINRAILLEARKEFARSGYEDARMDMIAEAACVSKGTLYDRYPTKQALLRAVVTESVATWSRDWESQGGPMPADLRQRLKHWARRFMRYYCSGELEVLERLFASSSCLEELRRMRHEAGHRRLAQVIGQEIIDGVRPQVIEEQAAIRVAEMLMTMLYGWWRARQELRRVTLEEALAYSDYAVDVLFEGRAAWTGVAASG